MSDDNKEIHKVIDNFLRNSGISGLTCDLIQLLFTFTKDEANKVLLDYTFSCLKKNTPLVTIINSHNPNFLYPSQLLTYSSNEQCSLTIDAILFSSSQDINVLKKKHMELLKAQIGIFFLYTICNASDLNLLIFRDFNLAPKLKCQAIDPQEPLYKKAIKIAQKYGKITKETVQESQHISITQEPALDKPKRLKQNKSYVNAKLDSFF